MVVHEPTRCLKALKSWTDVRLQFVTEEGAVILLHYTGLVEINEAFTAAAGIGNPTRFEDSYMRMAMSFDTGAPKYA